MTLSWEIETDELGAAFGVDMLIGVAQVPEPSTGVLTGLGLVAIALRRRRSMIPV